MRRSKNYYVHTWGGNFAIFLRGGYAFFSSFEGGKLEKRGRIPAPPPLLRTYMLRYVT